MKITTQNKRTAAARQNGAKGLRGRIFKHRVNNPAGRAAGVFLWLLLTAVSLGTAGCAGLETIKAQYALPKHKTLVIVDDPAEVLGNPNFVAVVGANIGFNLTANKTLPEGSVISQNRLTELAARMGDDYLTTPIDRVGQRLGAQQVVYVLIRSVNMRVVANYYRPTAVVEVKLIEVDTGARLFPAPGDYRDVQTTPPGLTLTVQLRRQTLDEGRRGVESLLARHLAERIGLRVAQLFYDHEKPTPAQGN